MGFIGRLLERRTTDEGTLRKPLAWMLDAWAGQSASGVRVNLESASGLSVFWCGCRVLADDVAKLPLQIYRRDGENRGPVPAHPVNQLLNRKPNPKTLAITFRQAMQLHVMTAGRAFAEIVRRGDGTPAGLHPINPRRVTVEHDGDQLRYRVTNPNGQESILTADRMLHIRGLGDDGIDGKSVIACARDSLGMGLSAQQYGAGFFARGMRPPGILKTSKKLNDKAMGNLRQSIADLYGGSKNAGKVPIFDDGLEWQSIAVNPEDAQFLESREFSGIEICQWLRVPPFKVFILKDVTNGSMEQQQQAYVTDSLGAWFEVWEQELSDKLLTEDEKADHYFKHNASAMLRGDFKTRNEGYAIARQNGWLCVNEIRAKEDLSPIEGGDVYLVPVNMTTVDKLLESPAAPTAPPPEPTPTKGQPGPMVDPKNKRSLEEVAGTIDRIAAASSGAMAEALRRVLHLEADKATRALRRGELEKWAGEFYPGHLNAVRDAVFPVIDSIVGAVRAALDPEGWPEVPAWAAYAVASWHVQASRDALADPGRRSGIGEWTSVRHAADADHYIEQIVGRLVDEWRRTHGSQDPAA